MEPLLVDAKMRLGFLAVSLDFQVNFTLVAKTLWPLPVHQQPPSLGRERHREPDGGKYEGQVIGRIK